MHINGRILALPSPNIDTDQIIPARYLGGVRFDDLGEHLFEGNDLLRRRSQACADAKIIVAGENFGCGSSREHAVWAIMQRGFKAVVAPSFGRIFRENAYNNGLLPIELPAEAVGQCLQSIVLHIHIEKRFVELASGARLPFEIDPMAQMFLGRGGYLQFLSTKVPVVREWAKRRS